MTPVRKTYIAIAAVFLASVMVFYLLPQNEFIQTLGAIPIVASLVGALVQIVRDQAAHDRALLAIEAQNQFALGASSHMANVAFDKHVRFSEEYAQEVHNTLATLFREGPTPEVLKHTANLRKLQQQYSVWLTAKIEQDLEVFEAALRRLGAIAGHEYQASGTPGGRKSINEMNRLYASVLGSEIMGSDQWQGEMLTNELTAAMVIRRLRAILGTEELSEMREVIVSNAVQRLRGHG